MGLSALHGARETAVVVAVPVAEPLVGEHRRRLDPAAAWGVPAHVTVLYPFVDPAVVDDGVLARLAAAVGSVAAFGCTFSDCDWFDEDVLWLAPDPTTPFVALTRAVWSAFPAHPPYGGEFTDLTPHLTVAQRGPGGVPELRAIETEVRLGLPIGVRIDRAVLIAGSPEPDSWRTVVELPLA